MTRNPITYLIVFIIWNILSCHPVRQLGLQEKFLSENRYDLPYRIMYPKAHSKRKLPLVIFLHGSGERGQDNEKHLVHVIPYLSGDSIQKIYPSIILAPQCAENDYWSPVKRFEWTFDENGAVKPSMQKLIKLIEEIRKEPKVDTHRIYVIGLSMGSFGTYDLIQRKPDWFAGAVPICGGGDTTKTDQYSKVPLWIFHGAKDDVVPPSQSRQIIENLNRIGVQPRYTEFPEGNHGIWENSIRYPGLLDWLFQQKK